MKIIVDEKKGIKAAKLIHSVGFGKDTDQLGFSDKLNTLLKLAERNERTKVNSIHISLNFDPSEKDMPEDTLREIADVYMKKIGFGAQPYLVYQHYDSEHPHIHIVTTNIRRDRTRIELHNIGKNQSEKARKEIEEQFKLVKADSRQRQFQFDIKPINAEKIIYGRNVKSGIKRKITNVLDFVLPSYKYTSLPELNAVLQKYNVIADQGSKESRIWKNGGLVYRVLDNKGNKIGVPIPASDFYNKPTLKFLQQRFQENEPFRQRYKARIKNEVDLAITKLPGLSIKELSDALQKENIGLVVRQNEQGIIYGLTYVDHRSKCVFNGSDLGKAYSANQVQQRCMRSLPMALENPAKDSQQKFSPSMNNPSVIEMIIQPSEQEGSPAAELREELKKKRRRKRLRL